MNAQTAQRTKFIRVMKIISLSALLPTRSIVSTCAASMESLDRSKSKDCTGSLFYPVYRRLDPSFISSHMQADSLSLSLSPLTLQFFFRKLALPSFSLYTEIIDLYAYFPYPCLSSFCRFFAQFLITIVENLWDRYQAKC